jgi:hypothetical protein
MGKRTNPIGLRLNKTQSWVNELGSLLDIKRIDPNFKDRVSFVLEKYLKKFGIELVHIFVLDLGFVCITHVFVKSYVNETIQIIINKRLHELFPNRFNFSYHNILK